MGFKLLFKNALLFSTFMVENYLFYNNIRKAEKTQNKLLLKCLKRNENSVFGKMHAFSTITSIQEYRNAVPIRSYDEYKNWLSQMQLGNTNILTIDEIKLFEPTGGSSGGTKFIPYTKMLSKSFHRGISVWLFDLYRNFPKMFYLKSYWLITPKNIQAQKTAGGISIGFFEDSQYLGKIAPHVAEIFVNFNIPSSHHAGINYQYATIRFLIETKALGLISIWHPSMLLMFMATFEKYSENIIEDIYHGTLSCIDSNIKISVCNANKKRGIEIRKWLGQSSFWEKIWPDLQIISCWGDAAAVSDAKELEKKFPNIFIQYKGLLATEAIITIPIIESQGNVPAYRSHFFEFVELNRTDATNLLDLKLGGKYKVILTNLAGLYRYDIGDIVEVTKFWKGLPLLKFLGRDNFSDLMGEKLSEIQVAGLIEAMKKEYQFSFVMLAPGIVDTKYHYILFLEVADKINIIKELAYRFEKGLCDNFYYNQARLTGQLEKLRIFHIAEKGQEKYFERNVNDGQKLGDIKPRHLDSKMNWENYFIGQFVEY